MRRARSEPLGNTPQPEIRSDAVRENRAEEGGTMAPDARDRIRKVVSDLEKRATRMEKEFERQMKALERSGQALRSETRKQLQTLRREQRGFVTRLRRAAKAPSTSTKK